MTQLTFATFEEAEEAHELGLGLPLVVSYGAGVDSTAVLVGLRARGVRPSVVIFADTGSEWPETYDYLPVIDRWLALEGFPRLTVVRNRSPKTGYQSLGENCMSNETLPSQAFRGGKPGGGACSARWKHEPMDRWLLRNGYGQRRRVVGYDAGPRDSKRAAKGSTEAAEHARDRFWYPLQEWGWDRPRCSAEIVGAGLPLPRKSSCTFCPAMKPEEIRDLARLHPGLLRHAILMEQTARDGKHGLRTVKGLARKSSWESLARDEKLLSEYGGPPDDPNASDLASQSAREFLSERTILT